MTGEIDSGMYIIGTSVEADIKIIEVREVLRADINTKKYLIILKMPIRS